jgi:hypothetical protein
MPKATDLENPTYEAFKAICELPAVQKCVEDMLAAMEAGDEARCNQLDQIVAALPKGQQEAVKYSVLARLWRSGGPDRPPLEQWLSDVVAELHKMKGN